MFGCLLSLQNCTGKKKTNKIKGEPKNKKSHTHEKQKYFLRNQITNSNDMLLILKWEPVYT